MNLPIVEFYYWDGVRFAIGITSMSPDGESGTYWALYSVCWTFQLPEKISWGYSNGQGGTGWGSTHMAVKNARAAARRWAKKRNASSTKSA